MNLKFTTVATETINGRQYLLQRAEVPTSDRSFWVRWRNCQERLRPLMALRKEFGGWAAYRRVEKGNPSAEAPSFDCAYKMRNRGLLLPYQPVAVEHLCSSILTNGAAADGADTGIGKTYVALAVCRELGLTPGVICKISGIAGWKKACDYFGIKPMFIINWEYAKGEKFKGATRRKDPWDGSVTFEWTPAPGLLLIFDEAHMGNNWKSQNGQLFMASKGIPSLSLSATFADKPSKLRPLLHVLGAVDKNEFSGWLTSRGSFINEYDEEETVCEEQDMLEINKILFPRYGYRLSYEDPRVKPYFPDGIYQTHVVSLGEKERQEHNRLYQDMLDKVGQYTALGKQAEAMVADLRYRQAAELLKCDVLAEQAINYIEQRHSVVIFVNFRETLHYLSKLLRTESLIYGAQKSDREKIIEDFQADRKRIIVSMVAAGGASISLHDLNGKYRRVSLICPTYDPVQLKQVLGRTRRAGSKTVPIMKLVYAAGTIEEKVAERVNEKLASIAALNDGDLMEPDLFKMGIKRRKEE